MQVHMRGSRHLTAAMLPGKLKEHIRDARAGRFARVTEPQLPDTTVKIRKTRKPSHPKDFIPIGAGKRPGRQQLVDSLRRHQGNVSAVADEFDRFRAQVYRWLRAYEIDADKYR